MAVINTNTKALFSQMALKNTNSLMSKSMEQLSTGKRINTGGDDAAGLAISTRMTQQIRALNQAVRNAGDAISLIQTAEGATNEITDMLQRMRELAIQAVNDTNANQDRGYLDLEFQQLKHEMVRIAEMTEWNGFKVLDGTAGERVGEMPVYKATSVSQFGDVFINPTTTRTIGGDDGGEQQTLTFTSAAFATGVIQVAGVDIEIDAADAVSSTTFATKVKETLEADPYWDDDSGRSITQAAGVLTFTFGTSDGDVDSIEYAVGATNATVTGATTRDAVVATTEDFSNNGAFLKSGTLDMSITAAGAVSATFTTVDNEPIELTATLSAANGTVTFTQTAGLNSNVFTEDVVYTLEDSDGNAEASTGRALSVAVAIEGSIPPLRAGDLQINGVEIGASYPEDDLVSPINNAAGSAIAKAAAINRKAATTGITVGERQTITLAGAPSSGTVTVGGVSVLITNDESTSVRAADKIAAALRASEEFGPSSGRIISYAQGGTTISIEYPVTDRNVAEVEVLTGTTNLMAIVDTVQEYSTAVPGTGVFARVNENIMTRRAMDASSSVTGVVFINGYASAEITTTLNNTRQTRADVVAAINAVSQRTGVKAIDTGFDSKGVTLTAIDGRNIEVRFETTANKEVFSERIGLRAGVQSSTISLESKIPTPVILTSITTGDISRAGFIEGNFTTNQSVFNTADRDIVQAPNAQVMSVTLAGTVLSAEAFSITVNGTSFESSAIAGRDTPKETRDALIALINADTDLGVTASAGRAVGELLLTAEVPGRAFTLSTTTDSAAGTITSATVIPNQAEQSKVLQTGDLVINGVEIRASRASDDVKSNAISNSSNRAASAIAIAEAINAHSSETGVRALPNAVITKGLVTDVETIASGTYTLYVNGVAIDVDMVQDEPVPTRIAKVVDAINERTGQHGVTALDNGEGVTLETDGRNLSVWFDSYVEDLSAAAFGLDKGGSVALVSRITVGGVAEDSKNVFVTVNGIQITASTGAGATTTTIAAALETAINTAIAANDELTNLVVTRTGASLEITSSVAGSSFELNGADVTDDSTITLQLGLVTPNSEGDNDVSAVRGATTSSDEARTLYGTVRLISDPALLPRIPSPYGVVPSHQRPMVDASGEPFRVATGDKGFSATGNFSALGFQEGSFGGQASTEMEPPKVGRLAFQVGSSAQQLITIDLADFGKNGSITGDITGDVDQNVEDRANRIHTRDGASAVLQKLDDVMERVNATRADMGSIMNRLTHAMDNLANVSMNQEASRSQIQDADYAKASTELAKAQIMQQAATAVLAQANMSNQTVLQLLQG
ncbi:MAG: flagellin [Burkholderiaceae bacterium]